ncbi:hypothetical protein B296_00026351 [Ensete ventricosum]|uniref:Uncharacterized protein n=1 Tax=Ensete ventricosum TaxID=4639 RepID=A0A426Z3Z5_ENSVE|nr:hypothetical protein B296_00026351 [Ensete ventricosum]
MQATTLCTTDDPLCLRAGTAALGRPPQRVVPLPASVASAGAAPDSGHSCERSTMQASVLTTTTCPLRLWAAAPYGHVRSLSCMWPSIEQLPLEKPAYRWLPLSLLPLLQMQQERVEQFYMIQSHHM